MHICCFKIIKYVITAPNFLLMVVADALQSFCHQVAISIERCSSTSIGIPMLKIILSRDRLIFNNLISGKSVFVLRQGPRCHFNKKDMASHQYKKSGYGDKAIDGHFLCTKEFSMLERPPLCVKIGPVHPQLWIKQLCVSRLCRVGCLYNMPWGASINA